MKDIRVGLKLLFNKLGCNNVQNKYVASEEISNQNLHKYLDIAGRRAHNIILMHEFIMEEELLPLDDPLLMELTPEKQEEEKQEESIHEVLDNIERELGAYKKLNVQNPLDEKMIER